MTRASISLTQPNDDWIQSQIENKEFTSRSEVVNALIRKARAESRERDYVHARLIAAEKSVDNQGWDAQSADERLAGFKAKARKHGQL